MNEEMNLLEAWFLSMDISDDRRQNFIAAYKEMRSFNMGFVRIISIFNKLK